MRMYDIIEKKRDGKELKKEEISYFIEGYCSGAIPDYQASALLMAIYFRGMNGRETADLTEIMSESGDRIDLSAINGIKVDKHSTGGVGDKTTLVLAPIVAACGVPVAKMSGKGLGHTGGTIDKLESIPGFRTTLSAEEFIRNVKEIGISITGQTGNLVPADKKLYSLRDVTATVNNIPLIASSIMSKKLASGADRIILDVKTGSGAFMKTLDQAILLAKTMVEIGERVGRRTSAIITDMDIPLGNAVGNSLEVIEAINTLKGSGPADLKEVSYELAARMLEAAGKGDAGHCRALVKEVVDSGKALGKFEQMISQQGGNAAVINDYGLFGKAALTFEFKAEADGYVDAIRTDLLGSASRALGAGRETKESAIDYTAGIEIIRKTGMRVEKGETLAVLHANDPSKLDEASQLLKSAFKISGYLRNYRPLILAHVDSQTGTTKYYEETDIDVSSR